MRMVHLEGEGEYTEAWELLREETQYSSSPFLA